MLEKMFEKIQTRTTNFSVYYSGLSLSNSQNQSLHFYHFTSRLGMIYGSILLNIHEVWPRPFWRGSSHQNKTPMDHFIGHIPFASLEGDKRPEEINKNQESFNILCPKKENNVSTFRVPPLIKIICLFAAGLGGSPTY